MLTLIFLLRKKPDICVKWPVKVKSMKNEKAKNVMARCHKIDIK